MKFIIMVSRHQLQIDYAVEHCKRLMNICHLRKYHFLMRMHMNLDELISKILTHFLRQFKKNFFH